MNQPVYLCVTPFFPSPDNWRGAYVYDQVRAIERNSDYRVVVMLASPWGSKLPSYEFGGIIVHRVPMVQMPSYFFNGFGGGANGRSLMKKLQNMGIAPDDIAVCHCHTAAFASFAEALKKRNKGVETVLQYHDLDPYQLLNGKFANWRPNLTYRYKTLVKRFRYIDLHLCISEKCRYNLLHFPQPHPEEQYQPYLNMLKRASRFVTPRNLRTYVLYNGVDLSVFREGSSSKNAAEFKIGCIANFVGLKSQITLIKAVEQVLKKNLGRKITVSFVGTGPTLAKCMDYVQSHDMQTVVQFEYEVNHEDLPEYYQSLDLFVLPSCFEGFGCVYTEAAACGVPFIGCTGQGYSEYVTEEDRDKWLISPGDFRRLAELIERQIIQPSEQRLKRSFDIDVLMRNYIKQL